MPLHRLGLWDMQIFPQTIWPLLNTSAGWRPLSFVDPGMTNHMYPGGFYNLAGDRQLLPEVVSHLNFSFFSANRT